ncbi:hypothetical protein Q7P37_003983 [Cladosporium fusiforme]
MPGVEGVPALVAFRRRGRGGLAFSLSIAPAGGLVGLQEAVHPPPPVLCRDSGRRASPPAVPAVNTARAIPFSIYLPSLLPPFPFGPFSSFQPSTLYPLLTYLPTPPTHLSTYPTYYSHSPPSPPRSIRPVDFCYHHRLPCSLLHPQPNHSSSPRAPFAALTLLCTPRAHHTRRRPIFFRAAFQRQSSTSHTTKYRHSVCPTQAVRLPNPGPSLPLLQPPGESTLVRLAFRHTNPLGSIYTDSRLQSFTFPTMITRESTENDMIMGRGAYDTTGTPKPKPPPKRR